MESLLRARLFLVAAALLFSMGGAAIKGMSLGPAAVAAGRSGLAFLVLVPLARPGRRLPTRLEFATAVGFAATMILYVFANRLTTAASAVFLQGSAPLFLLLLGPLVLRERPRLFDVGLFGVMGVGLTLFLLAPSASQATASDPALGNVLGAVSGLTWAGTILGLRALAREGRATLPAVVYGNLLVALVLLPLVDAPEGWGAVDLSLLLWLGVFQIGLAYVCTTRGMTRVPAFEASLLFLLEPAFGPLWAYLFHGEHSEPQELAGGALLILAGLTATLGHRGDHST